MTASVPLREGRAFYNSPSWGRSIVFTRLFREAFGNVISAGVHSPDVAD